MKLNRSLSSSIIALLIITILISACAGATSAEVKPPAVQAVPTTAPAKPTNAPKPTEAPKPTDMPKPAFDLNAKVTDFVANLPDNFLGMKNTDALKALQSDPKPFLIDLREPKEITQTIESAVNIPVRSLLKNLDKLPAKDQAILVYCGIGHRGGIAVTLLQMLGYTNAKAIFGGLNSWKAAGLPIVDSAPIEPKASGAKVEVDQDLLAALDAWLGTMPDDFWGMPPTSASKTMATDPKPFVIDVREPQELKDSGYIDGSVNIPLRELFKDMGKLPTDKTAAIITYCAIGQRGS
ncbi:MAG TPA: rhodanese-like domain-containing protein, partial [Anaerolineae bacterium]|nr:rhodanese-like domain-containing protein [Anaerolineae bacterium]